MENVLLRIECEGGVTGFGEAAVATHITGETVAQTKANLQKVASQLIGKDIAQYASISDAVSKKLKNNKSALTAVEMALLDAYTQSRGLPLWKYFGKTLNRVVTDVTIVIGDLAQAKRAAHTFYKSGFRTFKIKIGKDLELDIQRVAAVAEIAPSAKIILDANQALSAHEALFFFE